MKNEFTAESLKVSGTNVWNYERGLYTCNPHIAASHASRDMREDIDRAREACDKKGDYL